MQFFLCRTTFSISTSVKLWHFKTYNRAENLKAQAKKCNAAKIKYKVRAAKHRESSAEYWFNKQTAHCACAVDIQSKRAMRACKACAKARDVVKPRDWHLLTSLFAQNYALAASEQRKQFSREWESKKAVRRPNKSFWER